MLLLAAALHGRPELPPLRAPGAAPPSPWKPRWRAVRRRTSQIPSQIQTSSAPSSASPSGSLHSPPAPLPPPQEHDETALGIQKERCLILLDEAQVVCA